MTHNFEAWLGKRLIFYSDAHWLHPVFEFEDYLLKQSVERAGLFVSDKIIGKAAAMLLIRLGIRKLHAANLSRLAIPVLNRYAVDFSSNRLLERIACASEDILKDTEDLEAAYTILRERAGR